MISDELDAPGATERKRRRPAALGAAEEPITSTSSASAPASQPELAKELEDFGLLAPHGSGAEKRYPETDADVALVCAQLTRFGVDAAAPAHVPHRDRPPGGTARAAVRAVAARAQHRAARAGLRDLQQLAELAGELSSLLFWRDLRDLAQ